jgi:hypothetical protein
LVLAQAVGDASNVAACFKGLGGVAAACGAADRAATLWGAAEALLETREAAVYAYTLDHAVYEQLVAAARAQLGDGAFAAAWAAGQAMQVDHAIAYALTSDHTGP